MYSKKISFLFRISWISLLIVCFLFGSVALAQYPEKPVTVIVAYSPGGGSDLLSRTLFKFVGERLGVPFVIENHAGAGGQIGITKLSMSKPDGYTISNTNTGQIVMELTRETTFKIKEDFEPLAQCVWDPYGIYVLADSPFQNVDDLIEYAKANPDKNLSWGGRTKWDTHYLTWALLQLAGGVEFNYIPFDGSAETRTAILGGHIDLNSGGITEHAELIKEGKLRCLALASEERMELVPDVPTFKEQGYDIITGATRGFSVVAGVPQERVDLLIETMRDIVENDEGFHAEAKKLGFYDILSFIGGDDYREFISTFHDNMRETILAIDPSALVE